MERVRWSAKEEIYVKQGILTWDQWTSQLSLGLNSTVVRARKKKHCASEKRIIPLKKSRVASDDA
jgi:hypothetical protein